MKIGILGASGAVGTQMIECLIERNINVEELRLYGHSTVGKTINFKGKDIVIEAPGRFEGLDVVLGAASASVAREYKDAIVKAGAVFIDNSSAFRQDEDVPLVVPQINKEDVKKHHGVISNPNCSTIIICMALQPILHLTKIKGMIASTYQAVSGAGVGGIVALEGEIMNYQKDKSIEQVNSTFEHPILANCLAKIGSFNEDGYTTEEMKMENEGRKIMHLPDLKVTCTCVRVPVLRSHCVGATVMMEDDISIEQIIDEIKNCEGLKYIPLPDYPMPLETSNQDIVHVGRFRKDRVLPNAVALWCSGDQIRKGAASNAIEIMECL